MYRAKIELTIEMCIKLAKAQYICFGAVTKVVRLLLAVFPFIISLYIGLDSIRGVLLMAFAVYFLATTADVYEIQGKKTFRIIGERFRRFSYIFLQEGVEVSSGGESRTVLYKEMTALVTDGEYAWLFLNRQQAFMLALQNIQCDNAYTDQDKFKNFLAERSGLTWRYISPKEFILTRLTKRLYSINGLHI